MLSLIGGTADDWGFLLGYLDETDPRPAREQFHEHQPGGWHPAPSRLAFDADTGELRYPGDPPQKAISMMIFRNEIILLFPSAWVVIVQHDGSWEAARLD